jgi:16S rRNA G966 N2-methylase RsmD
MDEKTKQFILDHSEEDSVQLAMRASLYPSIDMALCVRQIASRQRAKHKIPSFFNNTDIQYPSQLAIEQSSSEVTARHKASLVGGQQFIDLTGGFGVDFYFIAKRFDESIYVERQQELCELAAANFNVLGLEHFSVIHADTLEYVQQMPEVDVVFVDPHRRSKKGKKTVLIEDCEPDLMQLVPILLKKSRIVLAKLSPMLDIHKAVSDLPAIVQIDILAVDNECKEILLLMKSESFASPVLNCYNYMKNGSVQAFHREVLFDEPVAALTNNPLTYLYEPNAAIMKSGAVNAVAQQFSIQKFHPNTHLYTANQLKTDFPGRIFKIIEYLTFSKKTFKYIQDNYPKANVSVRNFKMTAEEFRKKAKIKDGGDCYIFCFTTLDNQSLITICEKAN